MFSFIQRHKWISALIAANAIAVLVVVLVIVLHNAKTASIDIYVAPSEAVVELNGRKYDNFASYDMMPGDYHVRISMEGMQTKEYDFTLADGEFVRVWNYLLDENGGFDYYVRNSGEEAILEKVANDEASKKFIEEYKKVAGILEILPIEYDAYTDDYAYYVQYSIEQDNNEDCDKMVCLVIVDNTGGNEQRAIEKIREEGYDPDNYTIRYEYVPLYGADS